MKGMSIGNSKKIDMKDSSDSSSDDEDENVFMGEQSSLNKTIKKRTLSRQDYKTMKAELKRRGKTGSKGSKRRVEKLASAQEEIKQKNRGVDMMEF